MTRRRWTQTLCGALCVLCLLSACAPAPADSIWPMELSGDQQEVMQLLSLGQQEILLFEYSTDTAYQQFEVWVDVYCDGELIEPRAAELLIGGDLPEQRRGKLAVTIRQTPDFVWSLQEMHGGSGAVADNRSTPCPYYSITAGSCGPVDAPVVISPGQEHVLYTALFTESNTLPVYDNAAYQQQPELLAQYDYAHVIRCRFS